MNKTKEYLGIPCDENTFGKCFCYKGENLWETYYEYGGNQTYADESKCFECQMCDSTHYVFQYRDLYGDEQTGDSKTKAFLGIYDSTKPKCCNDAEFEQSDRCIDQYALFTYECNNCDYTYDDVYRYSHRSQCDRNVDYNKMYEIKEGLRIA